MSETFEVKFWGTRGSCPMCAIDQIEYGAGTSCVSIRWRHGTVIFDCGSGIAALGRCLEKEREEGYFDTSVPIHIFLSHLHLDHIIGLPLFAPLFWKQFEIHLYGPSGENDTFRERLENVIRPPYWPIRLDQVAAKLVWHEIAEQESWNVGMDETGKPVCVRFMNSDHPNECVLYRLEAGKSSVVYGLDCELTDEIWEEYRTFADQCSLLIFDSAYTETEYPSVRGFGHSYWQRGVEMVRQCGAKRLVCGHHDWKRTDAELQKLSKELISALENLDLYAEFIKEGNTIVLGQEG